MDEQTAPKVIEYEPHPSATPFHNSHCQVKAIAGPVGSGKSTICCFEIFLACQEAKVPLRALIMRETYRQLHDSTLRTWLEWFGDVCTYRKGDEKISLTIPNVDGELLTHEIDLRHARRAEEASQFMSTEYALIWLEEAVPAYQSGQGTIGMGLPEEIFNVALMRQRQKGAHRLHILLSFNTPNRYHWCHRTFFKPTAAELEQKGYALFRQPAFENERFLPPGYYSQLLDRLSPDLARRFVYGEPVTVYPGQRVFHACYEHVHVREHLKPTQDVELVLGFDFGLTPVVLITQVLTNGRLCILDELQLWNAGIARLAEALKQRLQERYAHLTVRAWGDPAGAAKVQTDEKTCFGILASEGFSVRPGAVDWASRFEAVHQRLERTIDGEPALLIDRNNCPILVEGMLGAYRYAQSRDGRLDSKPLKNEFSHVCDALQYLCTGEFSVFTGRDKKARTAPKIPRFDPLAPLDRRRPEGWMVN